MLSGKSTMWKCLFLVALVFIGVAPAARVRRHLVFTEGSRLFFSVNVRDNLFDFSNFFANVIGLKMDWNLPNKVIEGSNKGRIQRRDLYQGIESLMNRHNINGSSCLTKFFCEASVVLPKSNHFVAQLYEIIFSGNDTSVHNGQNSCDEILATTDCPLSLTSAIHEYKF